MRHANALAIQEGACNPAGITNAILAAVREARDEGLDACADPAVRLMVHQLAYICNVKKLDDDTLEYCRALDACEAVVKAAA